VQKSLKRELPDYMIPAAFVLLKSFPLTPNRKIDRKALPKPEVVDAEAGALVVEAGDAFERTVADIWKSVIGVNKISTHDNFFDAGGNSLLALRVYNAINSAYPQQILLVDLFAYPTISLIAAKLRGKEAVKSEEMPKLSINEFREMTDDEMIRFLQAEDD